MKWVICTSSCMLQALVLISNWNYHLKKSQRLFRQRNKTYLFLAVWRKGNISFATFDPWRIFHFCMRVSWICGSKEGIKKKTLFTCDNFILCSDTPFNFQEIFEIFTNFNDIQKIWSLQKSNYYMIWFHLRILKFKKKGRNTLSEYRC